MPVVINEFEVVPAPASGPANAQSAATSTPPPTQMTPALAQEITALLRRQAERRLRVWAY